MEENKAVLDINKIREVIPHRYPFLFVDRIVEFENNKRIVAIKSVTANEDFFNGHFPAEPVMPGALILEAMAQAGGILAKLSSEGMSREKTIYLVGATDFRWKKRVVPGDTLRIEMIFIKKKGPLWIIDGKATVDGELVASGTLQAIEG